MHDRPEKKCKEEADASCEEEKNRTSCPQRVADIVPDFLEYEVGGEVDPRYNYDGIGQASSCRVLLVFVEGQGEPEVSEDVEDAGQETHEERVEEIVPVERI